MGNMGFKFGGIVLVLIIFLGQSESAQYGEYCSLLLTSCDYEGGKCDVTKDRCGCEGDTNVYNYNTGECQRETPLGASCTVTENCTTEGAACKRGQCSCGDGFYDTRYPYRELRKGRCLPYADINTTCESRIGCKNDKAQCVNSVCQCNHGYMYTNDTCRPDQDADEELKCWPKPICHDENHVCLNGVCKGRDMTAVVGLQTYPGNRSLVVSWTSPAETIGVDCYVVRWTPIINGTIQKGNDDAGSATLERCDFKGVMGITGLVPGRPYFIEVASRLSCEEDAEDVFIVNITAVSTPEVPGPISDESDLDPSDDKFTVVWKGPKVGEWTHYKYLVISRTNRGSFYAYRQPKEPKAEHYMSDYGRVMNIEIQACTKYMGIEACSEKFETVLKTLEKVPDSVRDVTCELKGRGKIEVSWVLPYKTNGELTKIEIRAVSAVDGLIAWMNNSTPESLYQVEAVSIIETNATVRQALLKRLPKNQIFAIFVYAHNGAGKSVLPGEQDHNDYADHYYDLDTRTFDGKYGRLLGDISRDFRKRGGSLVPVCGTITAADQEKMLEKPKHLKPVLNSPNSITMAWTSPKLGAIAGFVAKVKDKTGCLIQYDFICMSGCLSEVLQLPAYKPYRQEDYSEYKLIKEFPEPDESCKNHTTVEMARDQMFPSVKYTVSDLPKSGKYFMEVKPIGYFQEGPSVKKKAKKPKKAAKQCDACVDPRNMTRIDELACNSTAVFYFKRGRLEQDDASTDLHLRPSGSNRFMYRDRKMRPKRKEILLPGSKMKKCACSLLKQPPRFKLAFLKVDPTGSNYILDYILSLQKPEIEDIYNKYNKKTCWKRRP